MTIDELKNRVLNGGCGSGQSLRLLVEVYENQIVELQSKVDTLQGFLDHDIEYDMDKTIQEQKIKIKDLEQENAELKEALAEQKQYNAFKCEDNKKTIDNLKQENAELKKQLDKARDIINCLVHLGEFNENTVEEYLNYQVHDALKQAEQFLSEVEK